MNENNFNNCADILENPNDFAIFGALSKDEITKVLSLTNIKNFNSDDVIFSQGDSPEDIYIILKGRIRLDFKSEVEIYNLKEYQVGDCFGQIALLGIIPYPATAVCMEETTLLVLPRFSFYSLTKTEPKLFTKLLLNITREICRYNNYLTEYIGKNLKK